VHELLQDPVMNYKGHLASNEMVSYSKAEMIIREIIVQILVFWAATPCILVRRFAGTWFSNVRVEVRTKTTVACFNWRLNKPSKSLRHTPTEIRIAYPSNARRLTTAVRNLFTTKDTV
jgi:hypothetical protein